MRNRWHAACARQRVRPLAVPADLETGLGLDGTPTVRLAVAPDELQLAGYGTYSLG
jgi:hypothetical protein